MMREGRRVTFGRSIISYHIEGSDRRRTVTIAVDPSAGVLVKAPRDAPRRRVDDVVKSKATWILRKLLECGEIGPRAAAKEFVSGESYSYLGRHYRLKIQRSREADTPSASLQGHFLTVTLPRSVPDTREAVVRRAVVAWYRKQAARRLPERVEIYALRAGIQPPPVLVRDQQKRWGSCNCKGELRFNWRVMMAPMALVDYVVAHEVCHVIVPDHSTRFWKVLETILPEYENRRARLRVEGAKFYF